MDEQSNVRRIPTQPAEYGTPPPTPKDTMQQRREKVTSTLGYVLAASMMAWVIILGWAAIVWLMIVLAEWRAS